MELVTKEPTLQAPKEPTKAKPGPQRNRILMLLENNPYPSDIRVRREALALVEAGYKVTVIAPRGEDEPRQAYVDGVQVYRFPAPPEAEGFLGYLWEYGASLIASFWLSMVVLIKEGFDVIHAHNPPDMFFFIGGFYKLFGKRFVFDHHDVSPEMYFERFRGGGNRTVYKVLLWMEKMTFRTANHVISTNESHRRIALERGNVDSARITIVRNGPSDRMLAPANPDPNLQKEGKVLFGYVGVLGVQDGLDYLLRALNHLHKDLGRTDFHCYILGDGGERKNLEAMTASLGLADHVTFTGWVNLEDLIRYMATVDIGVDPDPSNAYNDNCTMIKMTEYMAFGLPIVAFDLPEHRHTAADAALYVPDNDEKGFACALEELMDNEGRRKEMGAFGKHRSETLMSWKHSVPNLLEAYEKVCAS